MQSAIRHINVSTVVLIKATAKHFNKGYHDI